MDALGDWRRTHFLGKLEEKDFGNEVTVAGWVQDIRNLGGIAFLVLRDRTGTCQLTLLKKHHPEVWEKLASLPRESVIMAKGPVQANNQAASGMELVPTEAKVLGESKTPLPLGVADDEKSDIETKLDTRLDNRFIDLRKPEVGAIFALKHTILRTMREHFHKLGFREISTPKIVATATEGGTALFPMKYFENDAYLNQSPQLFKQIMMASGMDNIYEIGPAFRAEEHDTVRHLNEFISVDIEMAFSDEEDVMQVLEDLVYQSVLAIRNENPDELALLGVDPDIPALPFPRVTYTECVEYVNSQGVEVEWGEDLSMEAMKVLAKKYPDWSFVTRWPTAIKPFYAQPYEDDPLVCRAFDLNYAHQEITSGAQRVHDPEMLKANLKRMGLDPEEFDFYVKAFEYGMPPHSGWGLGIERIVMILAGLSNIRETVLFPRDRYRLVP